jgi:glutathione S-transferase
MGKLARKAAKKAAARKLVSPPRRASARRAIKKTTRVRPSTGNGGGSPANKERFTLHGFALSGPTYTVALMLNLCRHPYSYIHVNLREGAQRQPDYLVKNRYGQVPCLRDGQVFLCQSAAILEYLAEALQKFDGKTSAEKHRVREWLFWMWDRLAIPVFRLRQRARGFRQFGDEVKVMYESEARSSFMLLDHELAKSEWLVGRKPTIADIAGYGVARYANEAGIDITAYPRVVEWKRRIEMLPGFATPEQCLPLESRLL